MTDTPVVVLNGARQVGKSTLVTDLLHLSGRVEVMTLDHEPTLRAASSDPRTFVERSVDTLVIDEAQLEPRLFRAVKAAVDTDRRPGRFVLTGSARLLSVPEMADALVGRVEVIELWPFSEIELAGCPHEVWAKLACLACLGQFDPKMALKIQFTHQDGRQSHSSSMIAVIQDSFCFARVLAITDIQCGQLSPSIIQLLKEYCSRATLPAISYQIAPAVSMTWMTIDHLSSSSVLSEGWKPV